MGLGFTATDPETLVNENEGEARLTGRTGDTLRGWRSMPQEAPRLPGCAGHIPNSFVGHRDINSAQFFEMGTVPC